jgi:leucyl-tRNA synthetase
VTQSYEPRSIERRWQARWEEARTFRAHNPADEGFDAARPKHYVLDMFPYPSGSGLHVGHALGYVGTDIVARKKRMEGFNVLHPMGWDAFGLPAEQYAIQTGKHPARTTAENTANYRRQLKNIGMAYDWEREINTSDPRYYRWTQWLFKRLFERGLAYQTEVPVWWCEELKTVLANEEVINGRSERGNHPCERRPLKQWMLRITEYADRLLADLDLLDWPESIKAQQREWIGRSEGAEIEFPLDGFEDRIRVFTTRPDTLWGATFMVLAPEHPLVASLTTDEQRAEVEAYVRTAARKSELERTELAKEKTGVFTGSCALNPVLDLRDERARVPIWVADYVLATYGTGAIMAVPGGDERDFEFAQKYGLPIVEVCRPPAGVPGVPDGVCYPGEGTAVNSGPIDGLATPEAKRRTVELLEDRRLGRGRVQYKLRDWLFSRQRYWGEPFPLVHHADGAVSAVPDDELPVRLPEMDDFTPSADGSPPLARAEEWLTTVDRRTGEGVRRDTDTMPGWAGSCWYWLRFMDPHNENAPFSGEAEAYWGPVDLYIGGAAHAVMHLLYARFWHKVFHDAGLVSTPEPFQRLFNQGMVQAFAYEDAAGRLVPSDEVVPKGDGFARRTDGAPVTQIVTKMAKSLKNVVNPDEIIAEHGADAFRLYEMFMGPLADSKPWNPRDIPGCRRFLERVWRLLVDEEGTEPARLRRPEGGVAQGGAPEGAALELERELAAMLKRVDDSFEHFNFNTAIAAMMSFVNEATKRPGALTFAQAERFVRALAPFAPHVAEELWERLGCPGLVADAAWPVADERYLARDTYELVVQVNGKLRCKADAPAGGTRDELEALARSALGARLEGLEVVKVVVVPGRLVNFVARQG